jgi:hypothetical protein
MIIDVSQDPLPRYLVVLESKLEHSDYEKAAQALAKGHKAELAAWDGDWKKLEELLLARKPAELALVLDPGTIDANLPRRLIPILARFDDDPFVDCAFGLITGATGADALKLVERGLALAGKELPARKVEAVSVVLDQCMHLPSKPVREPAGRELDTQSLWLTGKDEHWREFLAQWRGAQAGAGLVEWGHCGDPQGIWLFSMYRNREREKHWPYDAAKVGQDPAGELPRLTPSLLLEGVELGGAVVLNGSCHSAVTRRAMVGPDIVSTFGDTGGKVVFFDIQPGESFPLQAIAHGAGAYIGPLAANNANRAAIEEWWLCQGGVSVGECLRRCYDELVMGAEKLPLEFALFEDGKPDPPEPPMFQSSFHRVAFGDPALVPWKKALPTSHQVELEPTAEGLEIRIRWTAIGNDPWVWDPWREARGGSERGRIYERIELAEPAAGEPQVEGLTAFTRSGKETTPLELAPAARLERDPAGKSVLHLVLRGPRQRMTPADRKGMPEEIGADLRVRFGGATTPGR